MKTTDVIVTKKHHSNSVVRNGRLFKHAGSEILSLRNKRLKTENGTLYISFQRGKIPAPTVVIGNDRHFLV